MTEVSLPVSLVRVVAAVASKGDRLLMCQRPANKRHGGLWEFPGGKCERGESDLDAMKRELREELGVSAAVVGQEELVIEDPGSEFQIAFFPVEIIGEPTCHEHTALLWDTVPRLMTLPLAPSDRRYLEFRAATTRGPRPIDTV